MNKLASLGLGFLVGTLIATALVALFAPVSGKALRLQLKDGFDETMDEARRASADRQRELEADLERKIGKRLIPGEAAHLAPLTTPARR